MSKQKNNGNTKVVTGKGRLSYAYIFEPKTQDDGSEKYSTSFLIPKSDTATLQKIKDACNAAAAIGLREKWGGKMPKELKLPLRDGDKEYDEKGEAYKGHWFLNATSLYRPGVCDKNLNEILDKDEIYSGCYACLCINLYPYAVKGNSGIACGLQHVQKVADGEPFSNVEKASDVFAAWDEGGGASGAKASDDVFMDLFDEDGDLPFGEDDDIPAA